MEYGVKKKPDSKSNYIGFYLPQLVTISFFFRQLMNLGSNLTYQKKTQLCFGLIKKIINK